MSSRPELRLDWCSHEAAKYAVEHWHYSRVLPAGKKVCVGVWEESAFIGLVLFSYGANNHAAGAYKLSQQECCELTRVALRAHISPVSRMVAIALRMIRKQSPGLRLIISYADPHQGHVGGIYQAGGWIHVGKSVAQAEVIVNGKEMHKRTANARYGTIKGLTKGPVKWKHKYLMPLDDEMRAKIAPLAKPYPKRDRSRENAAAPPRAEGGVMPTRSLHTP